MQNKNIEIGLRTLISVAILAGSVAGFVALGDLWKVDRKTGPKDDVAPLVEIAPIAAHTGPIEFEVNGEVVPYREIRIASEVAGRAVYVSPNCHVGRYVKKGETLVKIFRRDYEIERERLTAMKEQAESNQAELTVEEENITSQEAIAQRALELQQRELDRYQDETATDVFSPAQIDAARRNVLTAENALQTLTNQRRTLTPRRKQLLAALRIVEAQLTQAELDLSRTDIVAPIDGIVIAHEIETDGYLQQGGPIATIQDMQCLEVRCSLYMKQIYWLWSSDTSGEATTPEAPDESTETEAIVGSPIAISPSASEPIDSEERSGLETEVSETEPSGRVYRFPSTHVDVIYELADHQYVWDGLLRSYDGASVDPQTRMLPVRALIGDPFSGRLLRPKPADAGETRIDIPSLMTGMFVQVRIRVEPQISLLRIPEAALLPGGEIWLVDKENRLRKKVVTVAHSDRRGVLIYHEGSGLDPGDRVVISPMPAPLEGIVVKPIDPTSNEPNNPASPDTTPTLTDNPPDTSAPVTQTDRSS